MLDASPGWPGHSQGRRSLAFESDDPLARQTARIPWAWSAALGPASWMPCRAMPSRRSPTSSTSIAFVAFGLWVKITSVEQIASGGCKSISIAPRRRRGAAATSETAQRDGMAHRWKAVSSCRRWAAHGRCWMAWPCGSALGRGAGGGPRGLCRGGRGSPASARDHDRRSISPRSASAAAAASVPAPGPRRPWTGTARPTSSSTAPARPPGSTGSSTPGAAQPTTGMPRWPRHPGAGQAAALRRAPGGEGGAIHVDGEGTC